MNFRVGQKVVRIDVDVSAPSGRPYKHATVFSYPEVGEVVTIATLNVWPRWTALTFIEHDNSPLIGLPGVTREPGFDARNFRPAVDIEQFRTMVAPAELEKLKRREPALP